MVRRREAPSRTMATRAGPAAAEPPPQVRRHILSALELCVAGGCWRQRYRMSKIVKSKSKAPSRKKAGKKAVKTKRAGPMSKPGRSKRNSAETRGGKRDQPIARLSTPEPVRAADAERVTHRFPRPF